MTAAKKKTYTALMVLSGAVMAIDRFVVGDGAPIDLPASAVAELARPATGGAVASPAVSRPDAIPSLVFPRGLPRAELGANLRDFFAPPLALPHNPVAPNPTTENPGEPSARGFAARHSLKAVLSASGLRVAVVDDRWVREGDVIGGCRVESIHDRMVRVSCPDGDAVLMIGRSASGIGD